MRLIRFHSMVRDRPDRRVKIDFTPSCATRFARPNGRQDDQFQATGRRAVFIPQFGEEVRDLSPRQRWVMLANNDAGRTGQQRLQATAPDRRVRGTTPACGYGPV